MKTQSANKAIGPSNRQIRSWINRQRTLPNPSWQYIEWLRKTFIVKCEPTIIKGTNESSARNTTTNRIVERIPN